MICVVKNREGKILLASDNTWKAKQHSAFLSGKQQILTGQLGFVMTYDARCEDIMRDTRGLSFFVPKIKSGLPLDKNGFMLIQEQRSRVVRFKNQEDKP